MKLKNKAILLAIMSMCVSVFLVGCSKTDDEVEETTEISYDLNTSEGRLYKTHIESISKVEDLFNSLGINWELLMGEEAIESYMMQYKDMNNDEIGSIYRATYEATIEEAGCVQGIRADIYKNIDIDDIRENGFKFEESEFYDLLKIFYNENFYANNTEISVDEELTDEELENIIDNNTDNGVVSIEESSDMYLDRNTQITNALINGENISIEENNHAIHEMIRIEDGKLIYGIYVDPA
jgi:hypothetical protein